MLEDIFVKTHSAITLIDTLVDSVRNTISESAVDKDGLEALRQYTEDVMRYASERANDEESESLLGLARRAATRAHKLSNDVRKLNIFPAQLLSQLSRSCLELIQYLDKAQSPNLEAANPKPSKLQERQSLVASLEARTARLADEFQRNEELMRSKLESVDKYTVELKTVVNGLEKAVLTHLSKMSSDAERLREEIEEKTKQINEMLGHASGRVIAGDFEKSAGVEKDTADWLRIASLGCMAVIIVMLGYSFYETTKNSFDVEKTLFRVILAFLISAPTAYLARESAKHRAQQNLHLQTALDLKAISPYLASLPEETQNKIKTAVAERLFGGRSAAPLQTEPYPINVQELLMEALRRPWGGDRSTAPKDESPPKPS